MGWLGAQSAFEHVWGSRLSASQCTKMAPRGTTDRPRTVQEASKTALRAGPILNLHFEPSAPRRAPGRPQQARCLYQSKCFFPKISNNTHPAAYTHAIVYTNLAVFTDLAVYRNLAVDTHLANRTAGGAGPPPSRPPRPPPLLTCPRRPFRGHCRRRLPAPSPARQLAQVCWMGWWGHVGTMAPIGPREQGTFSLVSDIWRQVCFPLPPFPSTLQDIIWLQFLCFCESIQWISFC